MQEYSVAALGLLLDLENEGFTLTAVEDRLLIGPAHRITSAQRADIRRHRDELIRMVRAIEDAPAPEVLAEKGQAQQGTLAI